MAQGIPRFKTETHAECTRCRRLRELSEFRQRRAICHECHCLVERERKLRNGRTCEGCTARITPSNKTGRCHKCRVRRRGQRRVDLPPRRYVTATGYVSLSNHFDYPNANARGYILEHVKVMADHLGRPLVKGENVHHLNGVRGDNRIDNLELWVKSQPSGQRAEDLVKWAKEILDRYDSV